MLRAHEPTSPHSENGSATKGLAQDLGLRCTVQGSELTVPCAGFQVEGFVLDFGPEFYILLQHIAVKRAKLAFVWRLYLGQVKCS